VGTNRIQESYWKAGQYEMGKPYSEDLRERVIGAAQDGATIPEIAEQFGVSISSVVRFRRLHRETGSSYPGPITSAGAFHLRI
jgi:transposase